MICQVLCENADCGAFLDRDPVRYWDRDTGVEVLFCTECAEYVKKDLDQRYQPLADPQPKENR